MKKAPFIALLGLLLVVLFFFRSFILQGRLPIPSDTIVGLYHPFRDALATDYPRGVPYKNFLITDPVRQQFPWRFLAISSLQAGKLPFWDPFAFSGYPLLATLQGAVFYPLNLILFVMPFATGWSVLILLQPLLASIFMYLYLRHKALRPEAAFLGGIVFAFCGFMIAWLEWGTVDNVALWLPLILLSIDKVLILSKESNAKLKSKDIVFWCFVFVFGLVSSFFAGHLQTFFYLAIISLAYFLMQWWVSGKNKKVFLLFALSSLFFAIVTAVQWLPTLHFILLSARDVDQSQWNKPGWFIPWQNLAQFIAPDFFGNPTTLNYWGVWNYAEFVGYIGIAPLLLVIVACFKKQRERLFFSIAVVVALLFAFPSFFSFLPFQLHISFLSTAQPTRLLFLIDFSLAVLAAFGLDDLIKNTQKKWVFVSLVGVAVGFALLWAVVLHIFGQFGIDPADLSVAKHNLLLPTVLFAISAFLFMGLFLTRQKRIRMVLVFCLLFLVIFDLLRFADKFTPFTDPSYLFPSDKLISYLQSQPKPSRIMTTDDRILPPNFSVMYRLESVDGYDPLYPRSYGELIAAMQRGKPDIDPPFGFNRIITPHTISSPLINLLGVSYVLSFDDLPRPQFEKVYEEGQTKVYKNADVLPRALFVSNIKNAKSDQEAINLLFGTMNSLQRTAIVLQGNSLQANYSTGSATITDDQPNKITLKTDNKGSGFLVLLDTYYPSWHVTIDGKTAGEVYRTDYDFRGVVVPKGVHQVEFTNSLW